MITLNWTPFVGELFCECSEIAKNFNGYMAITVVMNFHKNFSIQVSWYFRKYFSAQNNSSIQ